jgi:hypothetical protein
MAPRIVPESWEKDIRARYNNSVNDHSTPKRKFDGKVYYLMYYERHKGLAERHVEILHAIGFYARAIHEDTKFGTFRYKIYARRE